MIRSGTKKKRQESKQQIEENLLLPSKTSPPVRAKPRVSAYKSMPIVVAVEKKVLLLPLSGRRSSIHVPAKGKRKHSAVMRCQVCLRLCKEGEIMPK